MPIEIGDSTATVRSKINAVLTDAGLNPADNVDTTAATNLLNEAAIGAGVAVTFYDRQPEAEFRERFATLETGVGVDPDAAALFARSPSTWADADKTYANSAIVALKAGGLWSKLDCLYVSGIGTDRGNAKLNWRRALYDLTEIDGGNLNFTPGVGFTGNGTSSALDTNFNPATAVTPNFVRDSAAFGVWMETAAAVASSAFGATNTAVSTRRPGDISDFFVNTGSGGNVSNVTDGSGLFVNSRTGPTGAEVRPYRNGAPLAINGAAGASVAVENRTLWLSGRNQASPTYSPKTWSVAFIGSGLTAQEVADIYAVLS